MSAVTHTILLVDDSLDDVRRTRDALRSALDSSYRVVHVTRVSKALDRLREEGFGLVLLEINVPDCDGIASVRELIRHAATVPVVVLSTRDDDALAARAIGQGAQDYLVKSRIHPGVLQRVARDAIERNRWLVREQELNRVRSAFVWSAALEMRSPLTQIREALAGSRTRLQGSGDTTFLQELETATTDCDRLCSLTGELLDLACLETDRVDLHRLRVDLGEMFAHCEEQLGASCRADGQRLELDLPDSLPAVLCDRERIQQALIQLLTHGSEISPSGESIVLRAAATERAVRLEIECNGGPLDDVELARIDNPDSDGEAGSSVGLAVARHIVTLHGGVLTADSRDAGVRMHFNLPTYVDGAELVAFIEDRAPDRSSPRCTSVVLLRVAGTEAGTEHLHALETIAADVLRSRRDEILLVEEKRMLALMLEAETEGCFSALRRLQRHVAIRLGDDVPIEFLVRELKSVETEAEWLAVTRAPFQPLQARNLASPRRRVLIVDDESIVLQVMADALETSSMNLDVRTTTSGYEACLLFGEYKPDLVVLDIHLPEIDGREVLASLKKSALAPTTKVLVVSGLPDEFDEMRVAGCDDCIDKPFNIPDLVDRVAALLELDSSETAHADSERVSPVES